MRKKLQKKPRTNVFVDVQASAQIVMDAMHGNKTHAAKLIGVSWLTLHKWLRGKPARPMYAAAVEHAVQELKNHSKAG